MFCSKRTKRLPAALLILGLCSVLATPAQANIRFFTKILQMCRHYRVSADMVNMHLEGEGTDNLTFYLTLPSRLNNFEEVILVGYVATGHAIARTGLKVKTIYVTVSIPKADNSTFITTAGAALVDQLRRGEIKSHEFMRQIEWIK